MELRTSRSRHWRSIAGEDERDVDVNEDDADDDDGHGDDAQDDDDGAGDDEHTKILAPILKEIEVILLSRRIWQELIPLDEVDEAMAASSRDAQQCSRTLAFRINSEAELDSVSSAITPDSVWEAGWFLRHFLHSSLDSAQHSL